MRSGHEGGVGAESGARSAESGHSGVCFPPDANRGKSPKAETLTYRPECEHILDIRALAGSGGKSPKTVIALSFASVGFVEQSLRTPMPGPSHRISPRTIFPLTGAHEIVKLPIDLFGLSGRRTPILAGDLAQDGSAL